MTTHQYHRATARASRRDAHLRAHHHLLEGGAMSKSCSYMSYDDVDELMKQPILAHMGESVQKILKNISTRKIPKLI